MKSFLTTLLLLAVPLLATAQLISNPYPPVPAAMAVAGAYTAAAIGAEAPFYNPAGLAYGKGTEGRFAYQQPWSMVGISHLSAAGYTTLPRKFGGIALGVQSLGTRSDGHTLAAETEAYLAHGIMLQKDIHSSLAFGYTLKLINYDLGESVANDQGVSQNLGSSTTFGLDVGATAQLWDRFTLGGSFKNINQPQLGANLKRDLPRMISGGLCYQPYYGVRTTLDIERVISGETQFKGGINATVVKPLDIRFGVMSNPNSFTAGFGLHWRELVIDYAFIYHSVLNPSHLIGVGFNLDKSLADIWQAK
ncbi:MAG TPA: conjugal transfer protein TraF [bacterium]